MIEQAMRMAPRNARVLVVGACMQQDMIHPMLGIGKELNIQFVLGYDPLEFGASLDAIANEKVDLAPLLTGFVSIDQVPQAFIDLGNPELHAKIIVEPGGSTRDGRAVAGARLTVERVPSDRVRMDA